MLDGTFARGVRMAACWKCHNQLRQEHLDFCPVCGAAQRPDEPNAARAWQLRLDPAGQPPGWALSLLWILAWPLAPITYPILMARASRRLKNHVMQRLAAPALAAPRFTQSAEGQHILRQLATSVGNLRSSGAGLVTLLLFLVGFLLSMVFLVPTASPDPISWENGIESVLEVRPARAYYYINSAEEYERFWNNNQYYRFSRVQVGSRYVSSLAGATGGLSRWSESELDTPDEHRPYEYLVGPRYRGGPMEVYQVYSIIGQWNGTVTAGILFYVGLGILVLSYLSWGLVYWFRFMRHARAEAVAAAYAKGDVTLHDALLARVSSRNTGLTLLVVFILLVPMPPAIFLVFYPILSAIIVSRHYGWEKQTGILPALGLAPPGA